MLFFYRCFLFSALCYLVLVKDVEDKGGKLGGVAEREELLVDLLKASGVQLTTGAVFNKTLIPAKRTGKMKQDRKSGEEGKEKEEKKRDFHYARMNPKTKHRHLPPVKING